MMGTVGQWSRAPLRPGPYEARLESLALIMIRFVLDPKKITIAGIMEMGGMMWLIMLQFDLFSRRFLCQVAV